MYDVTLLFDCDYSVHIMQEVVFCSKSMLLVIGSCVYTCFMVEFFLVDK